LNTEFWKLNICTFISDEQAVEETGSTEEKGASIGQ